MGRVGIDVAAKFASQVGDGSENATGNDLRFDLSEPDLDLVQPGRIGRGEVKLHARMLCEELSNRLRFMSGEVVDNDMNLLPRRAQGYDFIQESKEITTAVPGRGFSVHPAGFGVQRGIERKRAMAVVLEPMTLGASRDSGRTGSSRSRAWIAVFSSMQKTAACCGGFRYRARISAALLSNSGSWLAK